jgi:hypothetical protein
MNDKNTDLNFIKRFNKITIKQICDETGVSPSNLWTGRCSKEKILLVRKAIESKIAEIRVEEYKEYSGK